MGILLFSAIVLNEYFSTYPDNTHGSHQVSTNTDKYKQMKNMSDNHDIDIERLYRAVIPETESIYEISYKKATFHIGDMLNIYKEQGFSAAMMFFKANFFRQSGTTFLFYVYTIVLSLLFIYREKYHQRKLLLLEKQEDDLKIQLTKQSKTIDYTQEIEDDLILYQEILAPELNIENFQMQLKVNPEVILIMSRKITEKIILELYLKNFTDRVALNNMIISLLRKKVINYDISNLAHIIKAFGNKAVHANLDTFASFNKRDALLIISTLIQMIKELQEIGLIKITTNTNSTEVLLS